MSRNMTEEKLIKKIVRVLKYQLSFCEIELLSTVRQQFPTIKSQLRYLKSTRNEKYKELNDSGAVVLGSTLKEIKDAIIVHVATWYWQRNPNIYLQDGAFYAAMKKEWGSWLQGLIAKQMTVLLTQEIERLKAEIEKTKVNQDSKTVDKLRIDAIALIHVYNAIHITEKNKNKIVASYGWTSGQKLKNRYQFFLITGNRTARTIPNTPKRMLNKIRLFESVVELIDENKRERLIDEISILRSYYSIDHE
ncbi:MAG: hypothetical protein ACI86C_001936 [Candidatus Latescibacterota bacterium]|jgi:hypothetical protein